MAMSSLDIKAGDMVIANEKVLFLVDSVNYDSGEVANVCGDKGTSLYPFQCLRVLRKCSDEASKHYLRYIILRDKDTTAGYWAEENLDFIERAEREAARRPQSDPKPTSES